MFARNGDFFLFYGFLVEFLENRRSCESKRPPENCHKKWTFLRLAFYNAPSLHIVEKNAQKIRKILARKKQGDPPKQGKEGKGRGTESDAIVAIVTQ